MEITFAGPVFFEPEDEDRFFSWLESVPGFLSVTGAGRNLTITLAAERAGAVEQLLVLFRRWYIDVAALEPLRPEHQSASPLWHQQLHEAVAAADTYWPVV